MSTRRSGQLPKMNSLDRNIAHETSFESLRIEPFLKWAGGKRWMVEAYAHLFPAGFERYVEPFLGSAAIFFHLMPRRAILSDSNGDLINAYAQIRLNWRKIELALLRHHRKHDIKYYYEERSRKHRVDHERAAQFVYLNRVCWNGLYRVNLRGEFNVPIGTKTSVVLRSDDFEGTARLLRRATLIASDFDPILEQTRKGDFIFIDPPYVTRHDFNGFAKYNNHIFSWKDQERLFDAIYRASRRGAKILITNADHASIRKLYRGLGQQVRLTRHSILAAESINRSTTTEVAIAVNYEIGSA
jgi:DNA adenine methylase